MMQPRFVRLRDQGLKGMRYKGKFYINFFANFRTPASNNGNNCVAVNRTSIRDHTGRFTIFNKNILYFRHLVNLNTFPVCTSSIGPNNGIMTNYSSWRVIKCSMYWKTRMIRNIYFRQHFFNFLGVKHEAVDTKCLVVFRTGD